MAELSIWRWVLLHLARSPLIWGLGLLFLGSILLLDRLLALPSPAGTLTAALGWAHPAGLTGTSLALVVLSRGEAFLARVDPGTRYRGEFGALGLAPLLLQLPILAGALLSGAAPVDLARALPAILTADLQLASIASLFLLPRLSTVPRVGLFVTAVVLVPALCARDARLAPLHAFLDAGAVLRAPLHEALLPALAAAAALALAGYLLHTSPARAPSA
jgi:hypothetical protein